MSDDHRDAPVVKACNRLVQLIDSANEFVALAAAIEVIDRTMGKPVQTVTNAPQQTLGDADLTANLFARISAIEELLAVQGAADARTKLH